MKTLLYSPPKYWRGEYVCREEYGIGIVDTNFLPSNIYLAAAYLRARGKDADAVDAESAETSLDSYDTVVVWVCLLHSFYKDRTRPTGANNLLLPNSAMSYILASYQGLQVMAADLKDSKGIYDHSLQWYDVLELQSQGTMTPAQFDEMIRDVVNFLAYSAEPYHEKQKNVQKISRICKRNFCRKSRRFRN